MRSKAIILAGSLLLIASNAMATSFIVPEDAELVAKTAAIAIGTVEGSYVQETDGVIETVFEIRVERALKGLPRSPDLLRVISPGGVIGDRGMLVAGAPHFAQGDRVLLFLTRDQGSWRTTDLTLGAFRFVTSTSGERLLVRDLEDVVGWDHHGQVHHEKVRREDGFLRFIEERVLGRTPQVRSEDYLVDASEVTLPAPPKVQGRFDLQVNAPFSGATYTSWVSGQPTRWPNMAAGVTFRKRVDQNISGVADGGVSVIQNGLAAWNNECGSAINLSYGGTTPTPSTNFDSVHVVEFNDPQNRISGSWTGSGTIGICFLSFSSTHSFNGQTWLSITDADVVFQDGFPGTHSAFATAMTHELGHGLGWRHSNQDYATGGACNSSTQECTSAAVMNSTVNATYNFTLQPWDVNAAQSVYPGGTCGPACTPPAIGTQPQSATISGGSRTLSVTATGTTPLSYQWYIGASGNTSNPIGGATSSSVTVTPGSTTSYWVRVTNSCGTANSNTATITVSGGGGTPTTSQTTVTRADFNGDGRSDIFWHNPSTGQTSTWLMNGTSQPNALTSPTLPLGWAPVATGDFDADGKGDLFWRHTSTGETSVWLMNGGTYTTAFRTATMPTQWRPFVSADFDGNGRTDLFWRNTSTGQSQVWLMNGAGQPTALSSSDVPVEWVPVAAGDFNGDGRGDVFWRNSSTSETSVWLMNGANFTTAFRSITVPGPWELVGGVDFNGDGRGDVFWFNPSTGQTSIWLMNGTANPVTLSAPTMTLGWRPANFGDYNGNGTGDVFWRNASTGESRVWLMNSTTITAQAYLYSVPSPWRVAAP
jgi:FG-GAP-like repeat